MKESTFHISLQAKTKSRASTLIYPYEMFNVKLIANDKLGITIDILQKHLLTIFEFSTNDNKRQVYLDILEMQKTDLNFISQLLTIYDNINIINTNLQQYASKIDSKLQKEFESVEKEIKKNDFSTLEKQIEDLEEDITNSKNLMNLDLQCCTKEDLATTYQNLLKSKDPYEIMIMKNIFILLTSNQDASAENIRKKVHHFSILSKEMKLFEYSSLSLLELSNIIINVTNILDQIDPTKVKANSNYNAVEKYRHIVSYALWLEKACGYMIKKIKKIELENTITKNNTEKSINVDLLNYLQGLEEMNLIIAKSNQEQLTFINSEMQELSKKIKLEVAKLSSKLDPKFFPESSLVNSLLHEEEEKILDLYYHNRNSIYKRDDSINEIEKNSLIFENRSNKGFCGWCGIANNK